MLIEKRVIQRPKNLVIKKHVNAIHSVGFNGLLAGKIAHACLLYAYKKLPYKETFLVGINEFKETIAYESRDYKPIRKGIMELITKPYEWALLANEDDTFCSEWKASTYLASAAVKDGIFSYSYSPVMRELLYSPKIYGQLDMKVISLFKSVFSLNLYGNCIRFKNIDQTPWIELDTFRKLMGVGEGKYLIFRDLNKRVIKTAVDEVSRLSPLVVEPEFRKINKNVFFIRFNLFRKQLNADVKSDILDDAAEKDVNNKVMTQSKSKNELIVLLRKAGFADPFLNEVLNNYPHNYILEKYQLIMSSESYRAGKIREKPKLLYKAIKEDYKALPSTANIINNEIIEKDKKKAKKLSEEARRQKERHEYSKYTYAFFIEELKSVLKNELEEIIEGFIAVLKSDGTESSKSLIINYRKRGMEATPFLMGLKKYCYQKCAELFQSPQTFEEFIQCRNKSKEKHK